jgi:hypothetical protein
VDFSGKKDGERYRVDYSHREEQSLRGTRGIVGWEGFNLWTSAVKKMVGDTGIEPVDLQCVILAL